MKASQEAGMAKHRDDPRDRYNNELERLELVISDPPEDTDGPGLLRGNVTEADVDAIRELLVALDPKVTGTVFRANGNGRETKESKTLANYTARSWTCSWQGARRSDPERRVTGTPSGRLYQ